MENRKRELHQEMSYYVVNPEDWEISWLTNDSDNEIVEIILSYGRITKGIEEIRIEITKDSVITIFINKNGDENAYDFDVQSRFEGLRELIYKHLI